MCMHMNVHMRLYDIVRFHSSICPLKFTNTEQRCHLNMGHDKQILLFSLKFQLLSKVQ